MIPASSPHPSPDRRFSGASGLSSSAQEGVVLPLACSVFIWLHRGLDSFYGFLCKMLYPSLK
jgi:hypothetical protein